MPLTFQHDDAQEFHKSHQEIVGHLKADKVYTSLYVVYLHIHYYL